jgi:hypothetical protein
MKVEHKDFIAIYSDVYPEGYCQHLIDEFERLVHNGAGTNRQQGEGALKHKKDDLQLALNRGVKDHIKNFKEEETIGLFFNGLQRCYDEYVQKYSILKEGKIRTNSMKMQRTDPGGGYHIWHAEQGPGVQSSRVLVFSLYLNTFSPEDAGETEFLYQKVRIKPVENTLMIWPAAFTHAHRGNVVHGEKSKYIITGWFYYDE